MFWKTEVSESYQSGNEEDTINSTEICPAPMGHSVCWREMNITQLLIQK